jgi:pSer/pThr/pTyr-binding forkhead associated (FHA) protein
MIKDLDSRNGTFINKLKIEPLKETFFTDKDILSFGNNTNNKIMFFENNEQPQPKEEIPNTDSEKSKESDIEKDEKSEPKMEINRENGRIQSNQIIEEINTDTRRDIRTENMNAQVNNQRKERESNIGKRKN